MTKLDEFNPNNAKDPVIPLWATYCPSRRPNFKVHKNSGHARNAITAHMPGGGIIYERVDNEWVERERREVTSCEDCGNKFGMGRYGWVEMKKLYVYVKPAYMAPYVCEVCWDHKYGWYATGRGDNQDALVERLGLKRG